MTLTPDNLEQTLTEATAPRTGEPQLWRKAAEKAEAEPRTKRRLTSFLTNPLPNSGVAALLVIVVIGTLIAIMLPSLGNARSAARQSVGPALSVSAGPSAAVSRPDSESVQLSRKLFDWKDGRSQELLGVGSGFVDLGGYSGVASAGPAPQQVAPAADSARSVIRKATIELVTDDVRAAFAKASHLVSDAQGEYVQDSALTGTGNTTQAQLTLRIAVPRLSGVLDELRQLGTVRNEQSGGEDVTSQVVDLDARIRNEQRVETELLQLLEKRNDAPLKDILELRQSLSSVRQSIESLMGQRQRIGRLIDLATVLVLIRPTDEPPKPAAAPSGLGSYFSKSITGSWRSGLEFLADTVANLLALLVGGLIWWCLAALIVYSVLRYRRAALARGV